MNFILDAPDYCNTINRMTGFRWNDWNLREAAKHGCKVQEIESVTSAQLRRGAVGQARNSAFRVEGRGQGGRLIEVIFGGRILEIAFVIDPPDASVMYDRTFYVIHAMPLTTRRRRRKN